MRIPRRAFVRLAAGAAALSAMPPLAGAQAYPTRTVRVVVGFGAGSAFDILARLIAQSLSEQLGQPFIVENRPGGGSTIAAEAVVRARPDGYTLLLTGSPDAINATLYGNLNFNFLRDIVPIAEISRSPNVMVVHPSFPAKTVPEFIAYAKANPGRISMASAGVGAASHMSGELFKAMAGIDMVHVPYRSLAEGLTDLIGGRVQVCFSTMPPVIEFVKAGTLRALAVTSATRAEALPDLPTISEFLPGYESTLLAGLGAPRNTPGEIVAKLNREVNAILSKPEMKTRLADLGSIPLPMTPAESRTLMAEETEKWGKVVKFSGAKAE